MVLDGHGSYLTPQFNQIYSENDIVPIRMPPHSSVRFKKKKKREVDVLGVFAEDARNGKAFFFHSWTQILLVMSFPTVFSNSDICIFCAYCSLYTNSEG